MVRHDWRSCVLERPAMMTPGDVALLPYLDKIT